MVDYTKFYICNVDIKKLMACPLLDFKSELSTSTGEIGNRHTAYYHYCKIVIREIPHKRTGEVVRTHVIFSGSVHKLWNSLNGVFAPNYNPSKHYNGFNGNDFAFADYFGIISHLAKLFDCRPLDFVFENIEFGVNALVEFLPLLLLRGLILHRGVSFEFKHQGHSAQVEHQRFIIKIYDKSYQYGMKQKVIRVELKFMRMLEINAMGIYNASDITPNKLDQLKDLLFTKFDQVLYYDNTIDETALNDTERRKLLQYSNPNFWLDLKPCLRDRPKKHLAEIIDGHSQNLRKVVKRSISEKCVIINQPIDEGKCVIFNSVDISVNITQEAVRHCVLTGLDISMQKPDSILLSHTGLKYYQRHAPEIYSRLKQRFLTSTWQQSGEQRQIAEIAHNIRTIRKDVANKQKSLYVAGQERIFELPPIVMIAV